VNRILSNKWTKVIVFVFCLLPLLLLVDRVFGHSFDSVHLEKLGPNPAEFLQHFTGDWTLRFLILCLAVTPLRKLLNLPDLIRFRRMLGLFAFFYLCLHFLTYIGPDQGFDLAGMWRDVQKRRFITVGFLGFLLLIPLAITSTKGWIRRLGGKRWQMIHRGIYLAAVCGVVHYYWLVKSDVRKPLFYGTLVAILLLWRLGNWLMKRNRPLAASPARGIAS
jgi:methionine sulfoxide reductase heme-binding subunit